MGYNTIGPLPIASFNTTFTDPLKACECTFQASQASGTPTPANPISIDGVDKVNVSRTGKNLFDKSTVTTGKYFDSDGNIQNTTSSAISDYIKVNASTIYYFAQWYASLVGRYITWFDKNKNVISTDRPAYSGEALTSPNNAAYVRVTIGNNYVDGYQFEQGSTATEYEPYNGTTALINLGGTYYGGSVDCVTGKITLDHGLNTFDGTEANWSATDTHIFRLITTGRNWLPVNSANWQLGYLSNILRTDIRATGATSDKLPDHSFYITSQYLYVRCDEYELADFKTALGSTNLQIVAPLATPIVVYASNTAEIPTINGLNQVFADTGDVTVTYRSTQEFYKVGSIFVTANSNVNVSTESGELASFNTPLALPLVSLKASIVATESGSGTKSPTNPYTLGGFSNAVISHSGADTSNPDQITLALGQTVYGGEIVLTKKASGYGVKLRVTHKAYTFDGSEAWISYASGVYYTLALSSAKYANSQSVISDEYQGQNSAAGNANYPNLSVWLQNSETYKRFYVKNSNYASTSDAQSGMNGVTVVYPLATPIEIDLTDASDIVALVGTNNVWSDTGDMEVKYKKII